MGFIQRLLSSLEVNLAIFSGDWDALTVFVETSWRNKEVLSTDELFRAINLAKATSPSRASQFLEFAASQYPEDPKVLASLYFIATNLGSEDNQQTSEWFTKAVMLSNDEGPLHRVPIEELQVMMPDVKEKNERVYTSYTDGSASVFIVANLLNRAISDFFLIQALENKKTKDIRQKHLIPVFHSARSDQIIAAKSILVDVSSAFVMENMGLLTNVFDCFEKILIPHSFMLWLFEEKQKVAFHQPSQINKARNFEQLVSNEKIIVFHPKRINRPELALEVGDELAYLLEEVHAAPIDELQAFVVCAPPVYKIGGSFREVEENLTHYHDCLVSCSQLIKILKELAVITETQCTNALNYLQSHERSWPACVEVKRGAKLYLDSLSITHLMAVNMLGHISDAGFQVHVYTVVRERYKALINLDSNIRQASLKIENIRKKFFDGLEAGKVILTEMPLNRELVSDYGNNYARPTEEVVEALKVCDAVLMDDRFMNKHPNISFDEGVTPIFTSLDLIETLYHKGLISQEQKLDARTTLRELGFEFVRITREELEYHLHRSVSSNGEFKPNKQLMQIKQNLILIRVSDLVQLPRDVHWLDETQKRIVEVIKKQWLDDVPLDLSLARSCWLYELLGYREWAYAHQIRGDGGMAYLGEMFKVCLFLIEAESLSIERKKAYKAWVDEFVLSPLKRDDPWSFMNVVNSMKQQVKSIYQQPIPEGVIDDKP